MGKTEQRMAIGRRLASGIVDKGMTREEFAAAVGVSAASIDSWICGRAGMSFANALKICDLLGWPLDRLAVRGDHAA